MWKAMGNPFSLPAIDSRAVFHHLQPESHRLIEGRHFFEEP